MDDIESLRKEVRDLKEMLRSDVRDLLSSVDTLTERLSNVRSRLDELESRQNAHRDRIGTIREELAQLPDESDLDSLSDELDSVPGAGLVERISNLEGYHESNNYVTEKQVKIYLTIITLALMATQIVVGVVLSGGS